MNEDRVHQVYFGEDGDEETRAVTRARVHWIVDRLADGRILDLGCSQGVVSMLLAEKGLEVVGVDNEQPAIGFARDVQAKSAPEVQSRVEFVEADGEDLPFRPRSFDHAVCSEVLEHVEDPEAVVEELFRVLRPGGSLVVTVPFGVLPHPDHKRVFYPAAVVDLLEPKFEAEPVTLLNRHIGFVGARRARARRPASYALSATEAAFLKREEELRDLAEETQGKLAEANAKYRNATGSLASVRTHAAGQAEQIGSLEKELRSAEEELTGAKESKAAADSDLERAREAAAAQTQETARVERELAKGEALADLLRERVDDLSRGTDRRRKQWDANIAELADARARIEERDRASDAIERELQTAKAAAERELESARERADQDLAVAKEQAASLRQQLDGLRAEAEVAEERLGESRKEVEQLRGRIAELEGKVEAGSDQLDAAMAELREGRSADRERLHEQHRQRRARAAEQRRRLQGVEGMQAGIIDTIEGAIPEVEASLDEAGSLLAKGRLVGASPSRELPARRAPSEADDFDRWRERAIAAPGDEVIFMYSGTIYVQEKRGNRPIRLTRVYLEQDRPVFFNYWRWKEEEAGPDWTHPLLFQSPVDVTPKLLERLLEADFGGKRKVMFASFPHELMIRALSRAAQHGWITIYDARDDWEEFEKVGMAKWYDPGFEEYLVRNADVVTAVSEPLARKLCEMGNRADIVVVPNGLDSKFPRAPDPREPANPPVVGYFGHLTPKWFDWDLIVRAARQHPDWTFELAGHQYPEDLDLPENVKLLGLLGHAELAELSRRWSFALIPFKVSALGEAVDPIKVYEYLHLGLPVLSSYMPQMRNYPATVIAESSEDFLALLPSMVGRSADPAVVRPWLEENTWEVRIDRFSSLAQAAEHRHSQGRDIRSLLAYPYENPGAARAAADAVPGSGS